MRWRWLKGHAGHEGNERCDRLANAAIARLKKAFTTAQLKAALAQFAATGRETPEAAAGA